MKNRYCLFLSLALLWPATSLALQTDRTTSQPAKAAHDNLIMIYERGKLGYIDKTGKVVWKSAE